MNKLLNRKSKATAINEINVNGNKIVGDKNIVNERNTFSQKQVKRLPNEILHCDIDPLDLVTSGSTLCTFISKSKEELPDAIS